MNLIKEILFSSNTIIEMVSLFEFKIRGPFKSFRFKLTDKSTNVISFITTIDKMISNLNKGFDK